MMRMIRMMRMRIRGRRGSLTSYYYYSSFMIR
jgi:hypothetical protein